MGSVLLEGVGVSWSEEMIHVEIITLIIRIEPLSSDSAAGLTILGNLVTTFSLRSSVLTLCHRR